VSGVSVSEWDGHDPRVARSVWRNVRFESLSKETAEDAGDGNWVALGVDEERRLILRITRGASLLLFRPRGDSNFGRSIGVVGNITFVGGEGNETLHSRLSRYKPPTTTSDSRVARICSLRHPLLTRLQL